MQVNISTRHGHLSDTSRQKIELKVNRLTRIFDRLTAHEEQPAVDLRVSSEHKHDFLATDRSINLMGSVDTVVHRMEGQLRKYKDKIQHRYRGTVERDPPLSVSVEDLDEESSE